MINIKINEMKIKKVQDMNEIPYDLLILADPSIEIINSYIHRVECYCGYIDNYIVGIYLIMETRPLTLEIVNIAVKEEYQGKGIGKKLIFSAIALAKKGKYNVLEIGTGNSSIYQLALYQKCGFRIVHIDRDFFKNHYKQKIIENGIECRDMIRLRIDL